MRAFILDAKGSKEIEVEEGFSPSGKRIWIDVEEPHNRDLAFLSKSFGFHPLSLEDCTDPKERWKLEEHGEYLFCIVRSLESDFQSDLMGMFLSKEYLVTVHDRGFVQLEKVKEAVRKGTMVDPDFLFYVIVDAIVDSYFVLLDQIETVIDKLEESIILSPKRETLNELFDTKKKLLLLRKTIWPSREVAWKLYYEKNKFISRKTTYYFRDIHDHVMQAIDIIDTYRDVVAVGMDMYLSSVSNALNEVMKALTVITALVIVPTMIAGIYGMNFRYMPEIYWRFGYPFALALMLSAVLTMIYYFRKKGWWK